MTLVCLSGFPTSTKRGSNDLRVENENPKKKKFKLSLKERFVDTVSADQLDIAAQGITPNNTKLSNDWATMFGRDFAIHAVKPEDPVPEDLLPCILMPVFCVNGSAAMYKKLRKRLASFILLQLFVRFCLGFSVLSRLIKYY